MTRGALQIEKRRGLKPPGLQHWSWFLRRLVVGRVASAPGVLLIGLLIFAVPSSEAHKPILSKYTYNEDVFPVLNQRCGRCHMPGGIAPMSLLTYRDAMPWAESIRVELMTAHMPPSLVETGYGEIQNSHRLPTRDLDILLTWVTGGAPEGPARRLPAPSTRNDWKIGKPDLLLPLPSTFTLTADKLEETREFVVSKAAADRWIKAVDLLPGTPAIVRDATIFIRSGSGDITVLSLWLPGEEPAVAPAPAAFRWPANTELVARIHYKKTWTYEGKAINDRSTVGVYFVARAAPQELRSITVVDRDVRALALRLEDALPDKKVRVEAVLPAGTRIPLIGLKTRPEWNRRYWFNRPIPLPRGTRINVIGDPQRRVILDIVE
jgi:hypothetical protein